MEFKSLLFGPLPDVASQSSHHDKALKRHTYSGLTWVGMEKIQMPIRVQGQVLSASIDAKVNLKPGTRGIHMSRLYTLLSENLGHQNFDWNLADHLTKAFIESQGQLSNAAKLDLRFQLPLQRKALKSELKGWRLYPVEIQVIRVNETMTRKITVEVLYSSTCPASTALSRELWKQDLKAQFTDETFTHENVGQWLDQHGGMPGTPHAQRSRAIVQVEITDSGFHFGPEQLIDGLEEVLQTAVQTAVKRIDEQEFARLNGQNTMFCEDAARKVQAWLDGFDFVRGYHATFEHQESLHAHNAVAVIEK
jgi:GTP cyclohydrolase I